MLNQKKKSISHDNILNTFLLLAKKNDDLRVGYRWWKYY